MNKFLIAFTLTCVLALCSGCMTRPGGIAASTIPLNSRDSYTVIQEKVTGSSWTTEILLMPLSTVSVYQALQDAKKANSCDGLINVSAHSEFWTFFFIFSYYSVEVCGDAIKLKKNIKND